MNKNTLWLFVIFLVVYFTLVFGEEGESVQAQQNSTDSNALQSSGRTDLWDEARTRRHRHRLWFLWGWHALAIAYWVKVKLIIVGFFVGSAVFVGLRYVWPHKCASVDNMHDGAIVYDHPPSYGHHDHIGYSFDHSPHFEHPYSSSSSFEPYSGYAGSYSEDITATAEVVPSMAPETTHRIGRRSTRQQSQPPMKMEEKIAEFLFDFLGLDSKACRRRFVCEMEFRSRLNPLSSMAFRIVGRGFFDKYTNIRNELGRAHSFDECAVVNSECVFIEQNTEDEEYAQADYDKYHSNQEHNQANSASPITNKNDNEIEQNSAENHLVIDSNTNMNLELQNDANLKAERQFSNSRRRKVDRKMNIAERILAHKNSD